MSKVQIDYSFPGDNELKEFLLLTEKYIPRPLTKRVDFDKFLNKLKNHANIICARDRRRLAGASIVYLKEIENPAAFITYIAVIPAFWGKGLAKELLEHTKQLSNKYHKKQIKLEVDKENKRAISFYEKQGFQIEKQLKKSYFMKFNL
jgi:ribosomal protein S18 acetylase RimI-like enzyme